MKKCAVFLLVVFLLGAGTPATILAAAAREKPNLIVVLASDLGYGDVSCYGQKLFKTPRLDAMAAAGMRFTQFYAGSPIGAPSLCVLLTGRHGGRAAIRGDSQKNIVIPKDQLTIDALLKNAGYAAAERRDFAPEIPIAEALRFIREHKDKPFFLLYAPQRPAENAAGEDGSKALGLGEFAAKDWPEAEKKFAAAVQMLDRDVGRILDVLEETGIAKDTLVLFTSSNGPHKEGGHNPDFFDSNSKFRGIKGDIREGGIRVPAIACWPGTVAAGSSNDHQWYVGDIFATAAEMAGLPRPTGIDSDSLIPVLKGSPPKGQWDRKSPLYWEIYEGAGAQAVRFGKWKAIRTPIFSGPVELFDLSNDLEEKRDYSPRRADLLKHATNLLNKHHQPDPNWSVAEPKTATGSAQP
jgi:arylsulfatase A-like enzyme